MNQSKIFLVAFLILLVPAVVLAQVIYPNRGGTGNSTAPTNDQLLIGNGTNFDLKTLVAGSNVTIATTSGRITVSASLTGGGVSIEDIDTEAELEAILTDVTDIFTDNDGALDDDDLTDNTLDDLSQTLLFDPDADQIVFWDDSDTKFEFISTLTGLSITGNTLALTTTGDWTGTLDGIEGSAFALDTDIDDLSGVTDASTARSNLGLVIGTNVQAYDAGLADISALAVTNGNIIVGDGSNWVAESGSTARTSLGLGTLATLSSIDISSNTNLAVTSPITLTGDTVSINQSLLTITESQISDFGTYLTTVDISDDTNLVGGTGITLTGDTLSADLGTAIDTSEITDDTITHADIADADQADTKCIYFEDPTADDDFKSIWANKTSNDFLLTEIWAESDQTVAFDLQIDDGTPADVNGTDITPAAGEAEDTSLSGDTTLAAGEELDLAITSVTNTPTWVSICWTGNWVD